MRIGEKKFNSYLRTETFAIYDLTYLLEYTSREECYYGDDGDNTHITYHRLDRMLYTPQRNCRHTHKTHPVLLSGERFPGRPDRLDFKFAFAIG